MDIREEMLKRTGGFGTDIERHVGDPEAECVYDLRYTTFKRVRKACKKHNKAIKKARKKGIGELKNAQKACANHEDTFTKEEIIQARIVFDVDKVPTGPTTKKVCKLGVFD